MLRKPGACLNCSMFPPTSLEVVAEHIVHKKEHLQKYSLELELDKLIPEVDGDPEFDFDRLDKKKKDVPTISDSDEEKSESDRENKALASGAAKEPQTH